MPNILCTPLRIEFVMILVFKMIYDNIKNIPSPRPSE